MFDASNIVYIASSSWFETDYKNNPIYRHVAAKTTTKQRAISWCGCQG